LSAREVLFAFSQQRTGRLALENVLSHAEHPDGKTVLHHNLSGVHPIQRLVECVGLGGSAFKPPLFLLSAGAILAPMKAQIMPESYDSIKGGRWGFGDFESKLEGKMPSAFWGRLLFFGAVLTAKLKSCLP
jgi:hypothetical protein